MFGGLPSTERGTTVPAELRRAGATLALRWDGTPVKSPAGFRRERNISLEAVCARSAQHARRQERKIVGLRPARQCMTNVGENRVEQRRSALGLAVDDAREPLFRAAVLVCQGLGDSVRVQQKLIALVYWHDRRFPARGRQHRRSEERRGGKEWRSPGSA